MSRMRVFLGSLIVGLLSVGWLTAQEPAPFPEPSGPPAYASGPGGVAEPGEPAPYGEGAPGPAVSPPMGEIRHSAWINYPRSPGCCGPIGGHGPIGSEIYLRSGVALPFGTGLFNEDLSPGWLIEGGGRVLFFNPEVTRAWTVDFGLRNEVYNENQVRGITLTNIEVPQDGMFGGTTILPEVVVTLNGLNQTFVNLSVGHEFYLDAPAHYEAPCFRNRRVGFDMGGRWGSARVELNELTHRDGVIGAAFIAGHADVEFSCGSCIFQFGVRAEYNYTWSDILQRQNDTDIQSLNVLLTGGLRF
jgi:hypothetical protein